MKLRGQVVGGGPDSENITKKLIELYGPGDILGFQPGAVIRTDPKPNVGDFEPNYFPFIEFADPDFLWRFTAKPPDDHGNLTPWLTLIVLISQDKGNDVKAEFTEGKAGPGLPRYITVLKLRESLPDLEHAWRWAHVQAVGSEISVDKKNTTDFASKSKEFLAETMSEFPDRVLCRLLCPRRLLPGTQYSAFVIPTFELGRCAGLGIAPDNTSDKKVTAITLSWDSSADDGLQLPYYYRWDFGTGLGGDFEKLVRLLEPRKSEEIKGLGTTSLDCGSAGYGVGPVKVLDAPIEEAQLLGLEGALQPPDMVYTKWGRDAGDPSSDLDNSFRKKLQTLLNQSNLDITLTPHVFEKPPNAPPIRNIELEPLKSVTSITVKWITDRPMTSKVEFSRLGSETTEHVSDAKLKSEHELVIRGLHPGALYSFRIGGNVDVQQPEFWTDNGKITMPPLPSVTPPIYGRWHAAKDKVDLNDSGWCHELNLDPRHRTAAGFGAEVVRQQQEQLMADAWEQLADVEKANNLLRRAQLAREGMNALWRRIDLLHEDAFLQLTAPVHTRIRCDSAQNTTVSVFKRLLEETQLPRASMAPAFRRIARPRGVLRRRQGKQWTRKVIQELSQGTLRAAGQRPMPAGIVDMESITMALKSQIVPGAARPTATKTPPATSPGAPPLSPIPPGSGSGPTGLKPPNGLLRPYLKASEVKKAIDAGAIKGLKLSHFRDVVESMLEATDKWLLREPNQHTEPIPSSDLLTNLKKDIVKALDPRDTVRKQVWARIKITEDVQPKAHADPLDQIMWEPAFAQPMYEPLRTISQDLILPGIEKVPQNTVLVLKTNRRFLESYMVGLNHEFAAELLWRGYPTDQRGSYFRQFWDIRDHVPTGGDPKDEDVRKEKYRDIQRIHLWKDKKLGTNIVAPKAPEQLVLLIRGDLFKKYPDTIVYAVNSVPRNVDKPPMGQPMVPALREFMRGSDSGKNRVLNDNPPIYPIFRGDLSSDLSFFGFPFDEAKALGKYMIVEQAIAGSALRFGLDMPQEGVNRENLKDWYDLAWHHFSSHNGRAAGWYLNDKEPALTPHDKTPNNWWRNGKIPTSSQIAYITMQLPVRIAIDFALLLP
jgi:hypothetical protein